MKEKIKKIALISGGMISLGLAMAGILLPLLPTTPFLLISAACFIRSSDKHYQWLINHKWFGETIRQYRENKAIPLKTKIVALTLLWGTILYSSFFVVRVIWLRLLLIAIAAAVSAHILHFKTYRKPKENPQQDL